MDGGGSIFGLGYRMDSLTINILSNNEYSGLTMNLYSNLFFGCKGNIWAGKLEVMVSIV